MIAIKRSVDAVLIPSGVKISLQEGAQVWVTQALGNAYTVHINGNLVRIAGEDGDALGLVVLKNPDINQIEGSLEEKVWMQLKTCYDPEIPVNIVDLGLIYHCELTLAIPPSKVLKKDNANQQAAMLAQYHATIQMTLTAPGCGMGPILIEDIKQKIACIHEIISTDIQLVFDPPWDKSKMSDVAKLQLGLL